MGFFNLLKYQTFCEIAELLFLKIRLKAIEPASMLFFSVVARVQDSRVKAEKRKGSSWSEKPEVLFVDDILFR